MLRFLADLENANVVDLSTGRSVARVVDVIINPHNLSIGALICYSKKVATNLYLQPKDIFQLNDDTVVVQNSEALTGIDELVRIKELLDINYKIIGKSVRTTSKKRVGVITSAILDDKSFVLEKFYVRPPVTKLFKVNDLIIGRNQVEEVSDKYLVVRDSEILSGKKVAFGAEA